MPGLRSTTAGVRLAAYAGGGPRAIRKPVSVGNEAASQHAGSESLRIAPREAPGVPRVTAGDAQSDSALSWRPSSDKFRLLACIFLALFAAYEVTSLAVAAARGWPAGFGDSFALWSFGRFLGDHAAIAIYDPAALRSAQLALGMEPGASYPFPYPPSFLLIVWPLGRLPGQIAWAALVAVSLPLYLWATVGRNWRSPALVAALAAPTTTIAIVSGQSGLLAAGLLAGGMRLAAANPVAAGVLLGCLTYKPQLGLVVPVALLAARLWRTVWVALLTAVLLVVLTSILFGGAIWPNWAVFVLGYPRQFAADSSEIVHLMPTVLAALLQLGIAPVAAQLAQWTVTAATAAIVWSLCRSGPRQLAAAGVLVASVLATPYAFVYDMPFLATAVIWLVAERHHAGGRFGTGEVLVMMAAMIAPIMLVAGTSKFPLATLSLILLFWVIVRRCRRLRAATPGGLSAVRG